ncbi:hypothetical protein D3C80_2180060 [compost metagenome]
MIIECARKLAWGTIKMADLTLEVKTLNAALSVQLCRDDITLELTFGAVLSELVRGEVS